jgi:anthranilate synthase component 2
MQIALLDNSDSFTYNLALYLEECDGVVLEVIPAAQFDPKDAVRYDKLVISPGPGLPTDHPVIIPLIRQYAGRIPMLGVCLGLQAMCMAFGGRLVNLSRVYHGVQGGIQVTDAGDPLFAGLPSRFDAGRYHSWACDPVAFPDELRVTAIDDKGGIMAARHARYSLHGVQFHPESILTPLGRTIVRNFVAL